MSILFFLVSLSLCGNYHNYSTLITIEVMGCHEATKTQSVDKEYIIFLVSLSLCGNYHNYSTLITIEVMGCHEATKTQSVDKEYIIFLGVFESLWQLS